MSGGRGQPITRTRAHFHGRPNQKLLIRVAQILFLFTATVIATIATILSLFSHDFKLSKNLHKPLLQSQAISGLFVLVYSVR